MSIKNNYLCANNLILQFIQNKRIIDNYLKFAYLQGCIEAIKGPGI